MCRLRSLRHLVHRPDPPGAFADVSDIVRAVYRAALKDDPDPAGLHIYSEALRNGMPLEAVISGLVSSRTPSPISLRCRLWEKRHRRAGPADERGTNVLVVMHAA